MVTRIVKMTFKENAIPDFLEIFKENHKIIWNYEGCDQLILVQDITDKRIFFTISRWTSENALLSYRKSDFFRNTWQKTRLLFEEKPEAWSTKRHTAED